MKNRKFDKKVYRTSAALVMTLVVGAYIVTSSINAYANNIVITGDAAGSLSITSADTRLFDLTGLYPGDTSMSSVTITNTDMVNAGFEVLMFTENTTDAEIDLGQVTKLTVTNGNTTIYEGMLINFDENINSVTPIRLGQLTRGTSMNIDFTIEIDGEKADNSYQEQQTNFVVTFIANSYGPPVVPPGTGGGGGGTTDTPTPVAALVLEPESDETITIPDDDVPLGIIQDEQDEPDDTPPDEVIIEDEEVPLGEIKEMPKTGEGSLALYIVSGAIIIICGLSVIMSKGKNKLN